MTTWLGKLTFNVWKGNFSLQCQSSTTLSPVLARSRTQFPLWWILVNRASCSAEILPKPQKETLPMPVLVSRATQWWNGKKRKGKDIRTYNMICQFKKCSSCGLDWPYHGKLYCPNNIYLVTLIFSGMDNNILKCICENLERDQLPNNWDITCQVLWHFFGTPTILPGLHILLSGQHSMVRIQRYKFWNKSIINAKFFYQEPIFWCQDLWENPFRKMWPHILMMSPQYGTPCLAS